jgi:hypothetical protein
VPCFYVVALRETSLPYTFPITYLSFCVANERWDEVTGFVLDLIEVWVLREVVRSYVPARVQLFCGLYLFSNANEFFSFVNTFFAKLES